MALNRSDKSRILRRYFPGMTRNSEMSTEPNRILLRGQRARQLLPGDKIGLYLSIILNCGQGGMYICLTPGIGAGGSQKCFSP